MKLILFFVTILLATSSYATNFSIFDSPVQTIQASQVPSDDQSDYPDLSNETTTVPTPAPSRIYNPRPSYTSRGYRPGQEGTNTPGVAATSSTLPKEVQKHYALFKKFYRAKRRKERYAYINVPKNKGKLSAHYQTYVIDISKGKVVDKFISLVGYNGIGCGKGQTRPGIFSIGKARGVGASRKSHWGNRWAYQVIHNIGGHTSRWGGRGCGMSYKHVAHSNKNISSTNPGMRRIKHGILKSSKSAGCFTTSPANFTKWTRKQAGNALIYNVR